MARSNNHEYDEAQPGRISQSDREGDGYGEASRRDDQRGAGQRGSYARDDFSNQRGFRGAAQRDDDPSDMGRGDMDRGDRAGRQGRDDFGPSTRQRTYGESGGIASQGAGIYRQGEFGIGRSSYGTGERDQGQRSGQGYDARDRNQDRGFLERAGDAVSSWFGDEDAQRRREADHRGKGPKGYTRSDDRIREDVSDHLSDDWMIDASGIEVKVESGEVTLSGEVDSRQTKRRAEDCIEHLPGVKHVQNNLRVRAATGTPNYGAGPSSAPASMTTPASAAPSSTSPTSTEGGTRPDAGTGVTGGTSGLDDGDTPTGARSGL